MILVKSMDGKATTAQKGKAVIAEGLEQGPPTDVGESEPQNKALPWIPRTMPTSEDQRAAPTLAPAPPVPSPDTSGQEMRQAILLLTQLVAAQAQRQDMDHGNRGRRKRVNSSRFDHEFRGAPRQQFSRHSVRSPISAPP